MSTYATEYRHVRHKLHPHAFCDCYLTTIYQSSSTPLKLAHQLFNRTVSNIETFNCTMRCTSKLSSVMGLLCLISAPQILAHPLAPRQAAVTLQVLNDSIDKKLGCTAAQIATLQSGLSDASSVAAVAARTLSGVVLSGADPEAVSNFLSIVGVQLADETTLRLTNVGTEYGGTLEQITDLIDGNSASTLRFYCPAAGTTAQEGNPCNADDEAVTDNLAEGSINKIALCPAFFSGDTLASDTATYNTDIAAGKLTSFNNPRSPGIT
ncbi:hypothetical protein BD410DRAFT_285496 [Rickenella mellea]|uniref:Uncharacterized protein n=1 Tax=Rickenella mellea TaxID=50990 RepID=A0A4Y7Q397_9AGAM|nr:hypothetical protein BD410DRAFT_285496 [Rickenella mellea]